ncbi:TRAP transporter permease [Halopenitus persicus]|uniref:TRAP transporter, 4TM/12TM fusion protein n=1 Tax=Halopenitus persicus TaxID=1048396 RepID=A0A1H3K119_9EURY|nr:TRAP transporter fused permease subunit [Halopenitus persicus]SDY45876.1 TRAP transporter, 4TM/12TM fusion protein [Halopenitus persicus]
MDPDLDSRLGGLITILSLAVWTAVIYYAHTQMMPKAKYGIIFLGGMLSIYALKEIAEVGKDDEWRIVKIASLGVSIAITVATTAYLVANFNELSVVRVGYALSHEYILAAFFTLNLLFLVHREFGTHFLVIIGVGVGYGYFGQYLPGTLGHGGLSFRRLLQLLVLDISGFFGFLNELTAAWIALFLLYAAFLNSYGVFDVIFNFAGKTNKYIDSGVVQTAVISSAIIGSINGSQTANASMTGSITIPLMKRNGVRPEIAAAIESVASTSGQVLPPVMGAGAFVMASILGISYTTILVAGIVPALILVLNIGIAAHIIGKHELDRDSVVDIAEIENKSRVHYFFDGIRFLVPFGILVYTLGVLQWTVMTSALYTAISMLILGVSLPVIQTMIDPATETEPVTTLGQELRNTVDGFRSAAYSTAPIAIIMAAIGGVVTILLATGVPGAISLRMIGLTGGILLLGAILSLALSIILGLGMPTVAAYTIVALLVAPTLINQFGVPELAAHFFVFYGAILAGLTPPIAVVSAVAAGIAGAGFIKTAYYGMKIAFSLFILPFVFVYHPEILITSVDLSALTSSGLVLLGSIGLIYGINAYLSFNRPVNVLLRTIYIVVGLTAMLTTNQTIQVIAVFMIPVIYSVHRKMQSIERLKNPIALPTRS